MKYYLLIIFLTFVLLNVTAQEDDFFKKIFTWQNLPDQQWAGPDFWAQRLEDWRIENQKLTAFPQPGSIGWSTIHLLTVQLGEEPESFSVQVELEPPAGKDPGRFAGFLIGAGEGRLDHKAASMVFGKPGKGGGILAVADLRDHYSPIFFDNSIEDYDPKPFANQESLERMLHETYTAIRLVLTGTPQKMGNYQLILKVLNAETDEVLAGQMLTEIPAEKIRGNIALVYDATGDGNSKQYFNNLIIKGSRFNENPDHAFGPVAGTLYTISENTLKLNVQCLPLHLSPRKKPVLILEARDGEGHYQPISEEIAVTDPDYCALFRITPWDDSQEVHARVKLRDTQGEVNYYPLVIRRNPKDKDRVSMAVMSDFGLMSRNLTWKIPEIPKGYELVGRWTPANVCFPYKETVDAVLGLDIDLCSFTGDEFYENKPLEFKGTSPYMDGLWRWLMWHWAMQRLTSAMPVLVQIDDHGIYHGNIWGDGGKINTTGKDGDGGYHMSPSFLNMIQRLGTAHLPDPFDKGRSDAGITNYYTNLKWGGIGLALLEDRKFKDPPSNEGKKSYEDLNLLGDKQMQFIKEWGHDWKDEEMKLVLTQTVYANLHSDPDGDFARGDKDGNGWPKPARDKTLKLYRTFNAPVVCGDQHLPSFTLQGIDKPGDGIYQFCTPAAATHFWRWFYPPDGQEGKNRNPGDAEYLGDFTDPFGNYVKVLAMKQPASEDVARHHLNFRTWMVIPKEKSTGDTERTNEADGFGVVRFDKSALSIDFECYPYNYVQGKNSQHAGWPFSLGYKELDPREGGYNLPEIIIYGNLRPVIQIIKESTGETVKMMRIPTGSYIPKVFSKDETYTVRIGLPEKDLWKIFEHISVGDLGKIELRF